MVVKEVELILCCICNCPTVEVGELLRSLTCRHLLSETVVNEIVCLV